MLIHELVPAIPVPPLTLSDIKMEPTVPVINDIRVMLQTAESHVNLLVEYIHPIITNEFRELLIQFRGQIRANGLTLFPNMDFVQIPVLLNNALLAYINITIMYLKELHFLCVWALTFPGAQGGFNADIIIDIRDSIRALSLQVPLPLLTALVDQNDNAVEVALNAHNLQNLPNGV